MNHHKSQVQYFFSIFLVILVLCPHLLVAQEKIEFKAFGHMPESIDDSLYHDLNNAKDINAKLSALSHIADAYLRHGNADSVLYYVQNISELIVRSNNVDSLSYRLNTYRLAGDAKFMKGLQDEALKLYIDGLSIAKNNIDSNEVSLLNLGLAKVYLQRREYHEARLLLSQILVTKVTGETMAKANFYLGQIAFQQNDLQRAKVYFNDAKSILDNTNDQKPALEIDLSLGRLLEKENDNDKALSIYANVIEKTLHNKYYDTYTEAVLDYGRLCTKLERYEVAEMTLAMAYTNAIQWNRLEIQKEIINSLRLTYQAKGDYENAYNLMTHYVSVSDEITKQQNSEAIRELEVKYQTLKKENQIFELKEQQLAKQSEIERQKTIKRAFLYGFLVVLIPIVALLFVYYQKLQAQSKLNTQEKELNSQKIASLLNEQELNLTKASLKAQQNERRRIAEQLHDSIGGNLAGIKLQLANSEPTAHFNTTIIEQVNETYELVRDISHNLVPKKFVQNAFVLLLEEYIEKIKSNSALNVSFSAYPEDKINNLPEPLKIALYQIIQELFTNTIKHANATTIEIHLSLLEGVLQLLYEDDGIGFETTKLKKGIGLQNIESRLRQLAANIVLDSALQRGTAITIEIPLKKNP